MVTTTDEYLREFKHRFLWPEAEASLDSPLSDFEFDSLAVMEVLLWLEEVTDARVDEQNLPPLTTIGDTWRFLEQLRS